MSGSSPKVRASSDTMGATQRADGGIAHQVAQQAGEHHGGRRRLLPRTGREFLEDLGVGSQRRRGPDDPGGERAVEDAPAGAEVLHGV